MARLAHVSDDAAERCTSRGHAAPVRIETDARGVPTIRAQSIPDAMFGLGYAHARDRLWQMEIRAPGRLGPARRDPRRRPRPDGPVSPDGRISARGGGHPERSSRPSARRLLEAYAAGVNAFLAADSARPIEFRILRVTPEPWTPVDSLVWAKMMAWDLAGNARDEIRRARFIEAVGPERAAELLPLAGSEPTILSEGDWPPRLVGELAVRCPACRPPAVPWAALGQAFDVARGARPRGRRGSRQQLLGPRGLAHGERQADPRQRSASGAPDAVGLVPRVDRRSGSAGDGRDAARHAGRAHRPTTTGSPGV